MAFELEHDLPTGFVVGYWRVDGEIRINYDTKDVHFVLYGYKDKKARKDSPSTPATTRDIRMRGEEFDKNFAKDANVNLLTQCYAAAKVVAADDLFRGAEDV